MDDDQLSSRMEHSRSSPKSAARRRRPALSCTVCRRRKLKCDRALPCRQCIKSKTPDQCLYVGPQAGSLSSAPRAEDQDTTVNGRARASTDRGSPVYSGVYVFDSKHQRFPTRVMKPKSRSDEMQELRNRVLTLENALAKASSIQTPETLGAEPSIVSESGLRTTGDERYLSEDIKSLPWASFHGKKSDTRYCGRSHSMLALSFVSSILSLGVLGLRLCSSGMWVIL
jgi:hypothetical protein